MQNDSFYNAEQSFLKNFGFMANESLKHDTSSKINSLVEQKSDLFNLKKSISTYIPSTSDNNTTQDDEGYHTSSIGTSERSFQALLDNSETHFNYETYDNSVEIENDSLRPYDKKSLKRSYLKDLKKEFDFDNWDANFRYPCNSLFLPTVSSPTTNIDFEPAFDEQKFSNFVAKNSKHPHKKERKDFDGSATTKTASTIASEYDSSMISQNRKNSRLDNIDSIESEFLHNTFDFPFSDSPYFAQDSENNFLTDTLLYWNNDSFGMKPSHQQKITQNSNLIQTQQECQNENLLISNPDYDAATNKLNSSNTVNRYSLAQPPEPQEALCAKNDLELATLILSSYNNRRKDDSLFNRKQLSLSSLTKSDPLFEDKPGLGTQVPSCVSKYPEISSSFLSSTSAQIKPQMTLTPTSDVFSFGTYMNLQNSLKINDTATVFEPVKTDEFLSVSSLYPNYPNNTALNLSPPETEETTKIDVFNTAELSSSLSRKNSQQGNTLFNSLNDNLLKPSLFLTENCFEKATTMPTSTYQKIEKAFLAEDEASFNRLLVSNESITADDSSDEKKTNSLKFQNQVSSTNGLVEKLWINMEAPFALENKLNDSFMLNICLKRWQNLNVVLPLYIPHGKIAVFQLSGDQTYVFPDTEPGSQFLFSKLGRLCDTWPSCLRLRVAVVHKCPEILIPFIAQMFTKIVSQIPKFCEPISLSCSGLVKHTIQLRSSGTVTFRYDTLGKLLKHDDLLKMQAVFSALTELLTQVNRFARKIRQTIGVQQQEKKKTQCFTVVTRAMRHDIQDSFGLEFRFSPCKEFKIAIREGTKCECPGVDQLIAGGGAFNVSAWAQQFHVEPLIMGELRLEKDKTTETTLDPFFFPDHTIKTRMMVQDHEKNFARVPFVQDSTYSAKYRPQVYHFKDSNDFEASNRLCGTTYKALANLMPFGLANFASLV